MCSIFTFVNNLTAQTIARVTVFTFTFKWPNLIDANCVFMAIVTTLLAFIDVCTLRGSACFLKTISAFAMVWAICINAFCVVSAFVLSRYTFIFVNTPVSILAKSSTTVADVRSACVYTVTVGMTSLFSWVTFIKICVEESMRKNVSCRQAAGVKVSVWASKNEVICQMALENALLMIINNVHVLQIHIMRVDNEVVSFMNV